MDVALFLAARQVKGRLYPDKSDLMENLCPDFFDVAYTKWTDHGSQSLSEIEKNCLAIETFSGEVLNGGIDQYLGNESGAFAQWAACQEHGLGWRTPSPLFF